MTVNAFAEINPAGDRVEVHFKYDQDLVVSIKEVPGSKFVPRDKGGPYWTVPLQLDIMRRLREELGDRLVLGRALKTWGLEAVKRERNLQELAATDDWPAEDLNLNSKIPELTEWFRGYQRADVKFLASTSALNLNEQGLGKTSEIIGAIFEADLEAGPHLVVAPKTSLETVWRFEIERWTEKLEQPHEVITYHGELTHPERAAALSEFAACVEDGWPVWFVCTPQTVRDAKQPDVEWATFTIDEYHKTGLTRAIGGNDPKKNSKFTLAVRKVKAKRRYAMTGTPMGGKPRKLWGALNFLYPDQYTSAWTWYKTWLQVSGNGFGAEIGGIQYGREEDFYAALAPFVCRRLKSEVLPQLPPKQYVDVWYELTPKQRKQYDMMANQAEAELEGQKFSALGILAAYTRLKQFADAYCEKADVKMVTCSRCEGTGQTPDTGARDPSDWDQQTEDLPLIECPRCEGTGQREAWHALPTEEAGFLPYLLERLEEAGIDPDDPEGDKQAIVASQFSEVAKMVHAWLNKKGISAELIIGDTKGEDRADIQRRFQAGGKYAPRVVVMTTTAGGVAITLDRADTVHILDETWNPDDQEQLADRAHRASRMHQVTVYTYRARNTIEEQIEETVKDKAAVNREILDLRRNGFRANMKEKMEEAAA